jgi:hypothetical protein
MAHSSSMRMLFAVIAPLWMLAGCAGTDGAGVQTSVIRASNAVPSDYRAIIARNVRAKVPPNSVVQAEISAPGLWVGPMGLGPQRPIACVKWQQKSEYGTSEQSLGYMFAEGLIDETFDFNPFKNGGLVPAMAKHAYTCGSLKYGPFPELTGQR